MKVKELINLLSKIENQEAEVILWDMGAGGMVSLTSITNMDDKYILLEGEELEQI